MQLPAEVQGAEGGGDAGEVVVAQAERPELPQAADIAGQLVDAVVAEVKVLQTRPGLLDPLFTLERESTHSTLPIIQVKKLLFGW